MVKPFGGDDYPDEWDARAAGFIRFIERTTGHDYDHPVEIRFLPDAQFTELVAEDPESLDDETRMAYADGEAQGRALGLFSGSTDVAEEQNDLNTSGILAYYSFEDREVVVRLPEGVDAADVATTDDLPLDLQITMVHELTHVLQDQIYNLDELSNAAGTDEEYSAVLGLIEGHAEHVAQLYVTNEFTPEQQDEYYEAQGELSDEYEEDTADITPVLAAAQSAPYALGPPFVAAVDVSGGKRAIDDAFADPPTTERELMQPIVYIEDGTKPDVEVAEPPEDAETLAGDTLGSTTLYFMLSVGLPPNEALRAVDAAAADAYVAYRLDDQVCVDIAVAVADTAAADTLDVGFKAWAAARPAEAEASVERDAEAFNLHACDPGAGVDQTVPDETAIDQLFGRAADLGYFAQNGWSLEEATCVANGLYYEFTSEQLLEFSTEVEEFFTDLDATCS